MMGKMEVEAGVEIPIPQKVSEVLNKLRILRKKYRYRIFSTTSN